MFPAQSQKHPAHRGDEDGDDEVRPDDDERHKVRRRRLVLGVHDWKHHFLPRLYGDRLKHHQQRRPETIKGLVPVFRIAH